MTWQHAGTLAGGGGGVAGIGDVPGLPTALATITDRLTLVESSVSFSTEEVLTSKISPHTGKRFWRRTLVQPLLPQSSTEYTMFPVAPYGTLDDWRVDDLGWLRISTGAAPSGGYMIPQTSVSATNQIQATWTVTPAEGFRVQLRTGVTTYKTYGPVYITVEYTKVEDPVADVAPVGGITPAVPGWQVTLDDLTGRLAAVETRTPGILVLTEGDPVPDGTLPGTLIVYTPPPPVPPVFTVHTGAADMSTVIGTSATADLTFALPAGLTVGDLLLVHVASQSAMATGDGWACPTGWTIVGSATETGAFNAARHYAVFGRYIDSAATLAGLGTSLTVRGGALDPVSRHGGVLLRATLAHPTGWNAGRGSLWPTTASPTAFTLAPITPAVPVAGCLALVFANTSVNSLQADAIMTDPAWVKAARVVIEAGTGTPPAASELIVWWRPATGTAQPGAAGTVAPPSTSDVTGMQYAIRGA